MPNYVVTSEPTLLALTGLAYWTLSLPASAPCSVVAWGDMTGAQVLGTVVPGAAAINVFAPSGQIWVSTLGPGLPNLTYSATVDPRYGGLLPSYDPLYATSPLTNSTLGQNTLYFVPFDLAENVNVGRVNIFQSIATVFSNSNASGSGGLTVSAAIYSRGSGTNTVNINSIWSGSYGFSFSNSSNTGVTFQNPQGLLNSNAVSTVSATFSGSVAATSYIVNSIGGFREIPIPVGLTLQPGRYWMAIGKSTNSANASFAIDASIVQQTIGNQIAFVPMGVNSVASNASFYNVFAGMGTYSATSGAFPGTVALSTNQILGAPTMTLPFFNFSADLGATNEL